MKILPTLEGGLRIDAEEPGDWMLLQGITHDAVSCDENLAHRLGGLITDEDVAPDWQEYIVPDLDEAFHADLSYIASAIAAARVECGGGPGPLWITTEDAFHWYSSLNQARLALEEIHRFGPSEHLSPSDLPPQNHNAFLRSQFYCAIQSLLLEHVMR
ncbi:MAG: hypothetical protein Q8Q59_01735 [Luteolibacter sp.]|nr:hypothetical protein [Luteolibacter sp.]